MIGLALVWGTVTLVIATMPRRVRREVHRKGHLWRREDVHISMFCYGCALVTAVLTMVCVVAA